MPVRSRRWRVFAAATGCILLQAASAAAGSRTTSVSSSVTVRVDCNVSASSLSFGTYDPTVANVSAPLDQSGTLSIACTKGATGVTVGLDNGSHSSHGGASSRAMSGGGGTPSYLGYDLYRDAARTILWTNGGGGLVSLPVPTTKAPQVLSVYGRVPGGQDVPAASFSDAVIATVNF